MSSGPANQTRVVCQTDIASFVVIGASENIIKSWRTDKTIPLTEVVDSFQVFTLTKGSEGELFKASKQQLENAFGTSKDVDVCAKILSEGKISPHRQHTGNKEV
ncbi:SBDS family protein Rtc3 [Schizosaccharomyces cryophilus OY26]|uniref:SBDS family protein Rtc3 n=1 Tax=Schizosaccharomyces cryophilus (strain OY26 / ATCC MYA-4695 / CBS 11777 / NBRC 106824 / NRRL Y48691) TaxID=653667 RepID=S9XJ32_SCHCR|nr:SBDS family protein Rtc3 [Schizosaccharomyces cryophilus OY26]EPY53641.1 SBDS family protein Rtc3 [Schizosaccharomyces cryophilus OY26]